VAQRTVASAKNGEALSRGSMSADAVAQRETGTFQSNDGHTVSIDTDSPWGNEEPLETLFIWLKTGKLDQPDQAKAELQRLHGLAIGDNQQELFEALHTLKSVSGSALLGKAAAALQLPNLQAASYDDIESMIGWYDVNHLKGQEGVSARADMDSVIGGNLMVKGVPQQVQKNLAARVMDRAAFHKQLADEVWAESHHGQAKDPVTLYRLFDFGDWGKELAHPDENHYDFSRGIADSWTRSLGFAEAWGEGRGHRSIMRMTYDGSVPGYRMSFSDTLAHQLDDADYGGDKKWNQNELEILIKHGTFKITHTETKEVEEGKDADKKMVKVHYFDAEIV